MSNQAVANRYAYALFQLAEEKSILSQVVQEMELVKEVVNTTPEFLQLLSHPKVTTEKKRAFIENSFKDSLSETSLHTLLLLVENKRIESLVDMIDSFKEMSYEAQDMAEAVVYSAKPLTSEEQAQIAVIFAKKVNKAKLLVTNVVNKDLLGGLKIRIGDRIYDGSVKSQLDRLERQLIAGTR
ncbi:ATP synthase delta subunit [Alkalihalophilus pseudofirmus OF4]|uniref:ATP synthase subunit delta n=1 Tax=Alkalihalophilus pseudofirmus (strain ATCC BAA-2126 / JCM 17055 / OF4) TaxID=398511 RepID=ATPD_ALKPO|nr:F0F1 ATP synthase subunit delta [Alkalihalophilus pseudofirmus]P22479.2 RecName: Full=ATP synthase subunit delta; AltName: Full=ATP synthase F(1) sector subunit delta; AltName: Full=F-type ATPase subunit delta; Short=F-ATPase subunit delta [Alkalihalophilus pseudofirmus OF4]AAG48360.1 ATP synthase delta subunit [Alkalihalophilus pseudofirmus OF4]ADC49431.1 ATP synthase delta subunit [Alkalihalophilus pseudofirmus OF4]